MHNYSFVYRVQDNDSDSECSASSDSEDRTDDYNDNCDNNLKCSNAVPLQYSKINESWSKSRKMTEKIKKTCVKPKGESKHDGSKKRKCQFSDQR